MTPLVIAAYCGAAFVVLSLLTAFLQVRKMQQFEKGPFTESVFKGMLPIMICGLLSTFSAIGGFIALCFHFIEVFRP